MATYQVKPGDTLESIAKQFGFKDFKSAGITGFKSGNPNLIYPGETLTLNDKPVQGIVSSTPARTELTNGAAQLESILAQEDPYAPIMQRYFSNANETSKAQEKTDIKSTTGSYGALEKKAQQDSARYRAGLETAAIQSGSSRYTPELAAGIMQQARDMETQKLLEIQQKEEMAIAKAKAARMERDAKTLKEQIDYIREVRKEKQRQLERLQDMEWEKYKFETTRADKKLSDANATLSPTALKQAFESGLNKILSGGQFIGETGVPYMTETGYITYEGLRDILEIGAQSGYSRKELLEKVAPYLQGKKRNLGPKGYGLTQSDITMLGY